MKLLRYILPLASFTPFFAFAQTVNLTWFDGLLSALSTLVTNLLPFILALALLFFLWGVFQYFIFGADDEDKREKAKHVMIYGLAGLVLMVAVWGIVNLLVSILGVSTGGSVPVPTIPR